MTIVNAAFFAAALILVVEGRKVLRVENLKDLSRKLESVTGENSIQFNKCVSLTTEPADNDIFYSEENLSYAQRGAIVSAKSYVMFNVCETDTCEKHGSDDLYMVDLSTYLSALMGYFPNRRKYYCQACEYSQKYCKKRNDWNSQQKQSYFDYQKDREYQWAQQEQENYENQDQDVEEEQNAQQYNEAQNYYQDQEAEQWQYNQGQYQGDQVAEQYAAVEGQQEESYSSWMQAGKNWAMEQWYEIKNWWDGGRRRRLQNYGYYNYNKEPQNVETVTCSTCEQYGCFDEDYFERGNGYNYFNNGNSNAYYNSNQYNENQQQQQQQEEYVDDEEVYEWVTEMSECMQIDGQDGLYAGFICNGDGSGIEIGVFLDEACTIYNSMISYKSMFLGDNNGGYNQAQQYAAQQQGDGYYYWNNGQQQQQQQQESDDIAFLKATNDIVTYPFTHDINCADQMTYATPWGSYKQSQYYYNNQNGASKYCKAMFQGNSVMMQDCDEDAGNNYQQSQYQYYAQQDNDYSDYSDYSFYSYDLSQNDLYNQVTVCQKIKSFNGKYPHIYYGNNNVFDYSEASGPSYLEQMWGEKDRLIERMFESVFQGEYRGLKIFAFLAGIIFIAFLCLCMLKDCCWYNCCDCDESTYYEGHEEQPMATKLVPVRSGSDSESALTDLEDETVGEVNVVSLHTGVVNEIDDFYTRVDD